MLAVLVHCALVSLALSQTGNEYIVNNRLLNVEDGLASREVFCGIQDGGGFLWFGTRNGLNRFDGKNFQLFTKQENGLCENRVIKLAIDNADHLLILYGEGANLPYKKGRVDVMDLATQKISSLDEVFPQWPFKEEDIDWIANDGSGELCILTKGPYRVWRYSKAKGMRLQAEPRNMKSRIDEGLYAGPYSLFRNGKAIINRNSSDTAYFITLDSIYKIPPVAGHVRIPLRIADDSSFLFCLFGPEDAHIGQWCINGTVHWRNDIQPLLSGETEWIQAIGSSNDSCFIISPPSKGLYLQSGNNQVKLLGPKDLKEFPGMVVYQSFLDSEQGRWICTSIGALQVNVKKNRFEHIFTQNQTGHNKTNQARGIYVDRANNIYVNAWNYLFSRIKTDSGEINRTATFNKYLFYALHSLDDKLYAGASNVLMTYDRKTNHLQELFNAGSDIWSISNLNDSILLLGTGSGIHLFNTIKKTAAAIQPVAAPKISTVYRFMHLQDTVWAVAENGLYKLDKTGTIRGYYGDSKDSSHRLASDKLYDACVDEQGNFWLATNGGGLYQWNRKENTFRQFSLQDGFPSNILYRIESDKYGNLWISSDYGLIRFNRYDYSVVIYSTVDGLSHNEFNRISSFKGRDGKLYFGGLDGVNVLDPKEFAEDRSYLDVPLRIISFVQYTASMRKLVNRTRDLLRDGRIIFAPGDRFVNLEFQLLDYENVRHQYAFKIDGYDKEWNFINENSIRLSGLPYGRYTLLVKGKKLGGQWSNNELRIPVIVQAPVTSTWWFLTLVAIGILMAFAIIYHWRTRQLLKAKLALETTVESRTRQLRNLLGQKDLLMKEIHHRVKNNLQVISSLLDLQRARAKDENIKIALRESQNRVQSIAIIHQNLYQQDELKGVEMQNFANELSKRIKEVFAREDCTVTIENNFENLYLDIETAVPIGLIMNELLSNSFKYAFDQQKTGCIKLKLEQTGEGDYYFCYFDNGKGLPANQSLKNGNSMGLRLITGLGKQVSGEVTYTFDNGSKFELSFKNLAQRSQTL